jgi:hypothetical protein
MLVLVLAGVVTLDAVGRGLVAVVCRLRRPGSPD